MIHPMAFALSPSEIKKSLKIRPSKNPKIPRIIESMSNAQILVQNLDKNKLFSMFEIVYFGKNSQILKVFFKKIASSSIQILTVKPDDFPVLSITILFQRIILLTVFHFSFLNNFTKKERKNRSRKNI